MHAAYRSIVVVFFGQGFVQLYGSQTSNKLQNESFLYLNSFDHSEKKYGDVCKLNVYFDVLHHSNSLLLKTLGRKCLIYITKFFFVYHITS